MALWKPHKTPELFHRIRGIVTHSGQFHSDEVCAVTYLVLCRGRFNMKIVDFEAIAANEEGCFDKILVARTRDEEEIRRAKEDPQIIVIDVGGEYDLAKNNFDHHQDGFGEVMDAKLGGGRTTLSSFGLIFKHFWDLLPGITQDEAKDFYKTFVEGVDGHDNGIPHLKTLAQRNYNSLTVGQTLSRINSPDVYSPEQNERFVAAAALAMSISLSIIGPSIDNRVVTERSREIFLEALRGEVSSGVLVVRERLLGAPATDRWLREAEADGDLKSKAKEVVFIVAPRDPTKGNFSIWTRKKDPATFELVRPILSAEAAEALIGEDLEFVHGKRFVASTKSRESAIRLAKASMEAVDT